MRLMEKRVLVNLPAGLYGDLKHLAERELRSVSSLIRESVLHRLEETFTHGERGLIEQGRREFHRGKGKDWRRVRRRGVYKRI